MDESIVVGKALIYESFGFLTILITEPLADGGITDLPACVAV